MGFAILFDLPCLFLVTPLAATVAYVLGVGSNVCVLKILTGESGCVTSSVESRFGFGPFSEGLLLPDSEVVGF